MVGIGAMVGWTYWVVSDGVVSDGVVSDGVVSDGVVSDGAVSDKRAFKSAFLGAFLESQSSSEVVHLRDLQNSQKMLQKSDTKIQICYLKYPIYFRSRQLPP